VAAGHSYISPVLSGYLLARRADAQSLRQGKPGLFQLTPAERRVLKLIAQDKTSKEIAKQLGVSLRTIENHRTNICSKLDVHGIHSLLKFAFENQSRL
jgi:DNA-binding CsgD family transcriptional regulator